MKKAPTFLVLVSSLASAHLAFGEDTPQATRPRTPPSVVESPLSSGVPNSSAAQLSSIVKQLRQVRARRLELDQVREDFNRSVRIGGPVFFLSAATLTALVSAARKTTMPETRLGRILASRGMQAVGFPASAIAALASGGITGYELYQISQDIDEAKAALAREEADLYNLAASVSAR